MFGENLKTLRKNNGITQEELAARLNVVRQTVAKWEKDQSVPDALAEQLARINEQLVIKNLRAKRIWTVIAVIVAGTILLQLLAFGMIVLFRAVTQNSQTEIVEWTEIIEK